MANIVILRTNREFYNADDAASSSITVRDLIEELEHYDKDSKVVFSNDGGFTYGYINESRIKEI